MVLDPVEASVGQDEVVGSFRLPGLDVGVGEAEANGNRPALGELDHLWRAIDPQNLGRGPASHHRRGCAWVDGRAATKPMTRRRPASEPGEKTSSSVPGEPPLRFSGRGGLPGGDRAKNVKDGTPEGGSSPSNPVRHRVPPVLMNAISPCPGPCRARGRSRNRGRGSGRVSASEAESVAASVPVPDENCRRGIHAPRPPAFTVWQRPSGWCCRCRWHRVRTRVRVRDRIRIRTRIRTPGHGGRLSSSRVTAHAPGGKEAVGGFR